MDNEKRNKFDFEFEGYFSGNGDCAGIGTWLRDSRKSESRSRRLAVLNMTPLELWAVDSPRIIEGLEFAYKSSECLDQWVSAAFQVLESRLRKFEERP